MTNDSQPPPSPERSSLRRVIRVVLGMLAGGAVGLAIGMIWMQLADPAGFGDLAAAAVTLVVLVPAGLVLGGVVSFLLARPGRDLS
jgi:hypothetical protein